MDRTYCETNGLGSHLAPTQPAETGKGEYTVPDTFVSPANLFVRDEVARKEQMQKWCETLKHQGGPALLKELDALDLASSTETITRSHQQLTNYLRNNLHRTDYPTYVKNGWPIGSGRVESACKSVVATRLKGPGMRWRPRGTNALCHLRALFKSERSAWQSFWSRDRKPTNPPA